MESFGFANVDYIGSEQIQQHMLEVNNDITHLLNLAKDPKKQGELIGILDHTIDKVDQHVIALQTRLTEELEKRTKEFKTAIKPLDDPLMMLKSKPPKFLSDADAVKWHKLTSLGVGKQQLADFKSSLVDSFKNELSKQLHIEKLTEQNITIRRILDKIRQTLVI